MTTAQAPVVTMKCIDVVTQQCFNYPSAAVALHLSVCIMPNGCSGTVIRAHRSDHLKPDPFETYRFMHTACGVVCSSAGAGAGRCSNSHLRASVYALLRFPTSWSNSKME